MFVPDQIVMVSCKHATVMQQRIQFFLQDGKKILVSRNLKDYEEMLNGFGFYRIHQSHLINLRYIDHYSKLDGGAVVMKDKTNIPVARRKKEDFLKLLEMI